MLKSFYQILVQNLTYNFTSIVTFLALAILNTVTIQANLTSVIIRSMDLNYFCC